MQLTFLELRAKEVINTQDGRKLGRVCDISLCYPENKWVGIIVPGGRNWGFKKSEMFIDLKHIVKIGEDVVLVNIGFPKNQNAKKSGGAPTPPIEPVPFFANANNRNYEEFE